MGSLILPASGLVYVDTVTVIYSVEEHPLFWPPTHPLWEAARLGRVEVISSELTLMETLVGPEKTGHANVAAAYEDLFASGVRLVPISRTVLRMAARLRASTALRTPDAIHAATALSEGCALFVTNDRAFRRVPGLDVAVLSELVDTPLP